MEKMIYEIKPYVLIGLAIVVMIRFFKPFSGLGFISGLLLFGISAVVLRLRYEHRVLGLRYGR